MPSYEATFILKKMARPEMAAVLKRAATQILKNNGLLFSIENLGTRALPFKMISHGAHYTEGSYFVMQFDAPPTMIRLLQDEYGRDIDIIRYSMPMIEPESKYACTLEEEMKPAAYRKDVQEMIEEGRKTERVFNPKTGLGYNPWQRS